mmetsp:Transcript_86726/g.250486  ORF Transcript_86726/g.250486 Transcript_86726/m.250486 type:complete len:253 (+) Transcript_86726:164-922(+)
MCTGAAMTPPAVLLMASDTIFTSKLPPLLLLALLLVIVHLPRSVIQVLIGLPSPWRVPLRDPRVHKAERARRNDANRLAFRCQRLFIFRRVFRCCAPPPRQPRPARIEKPTAVRLEAGLSPAIALGPIGGQLVNVGGVEQQQDKHDRREHVHSVVEAGRRHKQHLHAHADNADGQDYAGNTLARAGHEGLLVGGDREETSEVGVAGDHHVRAVPDPTATVSAEELQHDHLLDRACKVVCETHLAQALQGVLA